MGVGGSGSALPVDFLIEYRTSRSFLIPASAGMEHARVEPDTLRRPLLLREFPQQRNRSLRLTKSMSSRCASTRRVGRNGRASRSKLHSATSGNGAMRRSISFSILNASDQPVEVVPPQIQISGRAVKKKKEGRQESDSRSAIDSRLPVERDKDRSRARGRMESSSSTARTSSNRRRSFSFRLRRPTRWTGRYSFVCPLRRPSPAEHDRPDPEKGDAMNSNETNGSRIAQVDSEDSAELPRPRPPLPTGFLRWLKTARMRNKPTGHATRERQRRQVRHREEQADYAWRRIAGCRALPCSHEPRQPLVHHEEGRREAAKPSGAAASAKPIQGKRNAADGDCSYRCSGEHERAGASWATSSAPVIRRRAREKTPARRFLQSPVQGARQAPTHWAPSHRSPRRSRSGRSHSRMAKPATLLPFSRSNRRML